MLECLTGLNYQPSDQVTISLQNYNYLLQEIVELKQELKKEIIKYSERHIRTHDEKNKVINDQKAIISTLEARLDALESVDGEGK